MVASSDTTLLPNDSKQVTPPNGQQLSKQKRSNLLVHDSVLIAQGAILCGRKSLQALIHPSFVGTSANDIVNLRWFEQLGRSGYSRVLVRRDERSGEGNSKDCEEGDSSEGGDLLGYIVMKGE